MSLQEHRGQDTLDVIDEKVMQGEQFFERHGKKIMIGVGAIVLIAQECQGFYAALRV